jgi:hypothetical protein
MDRQALVAAKGPRKLAERRTLDIARVAARIGVRVRARTLDTDAIDRRADRLERLRRRRQGD